MANAGEHVFAICRNYVCKITGNERNNGEMRDFFSEMIEKPIVFAAEVRYNNDVVVKRGEK